jgi:galactokinase
MAVAIDRHTLVQGQGHSGRVACVSSGSFGGADSFALDPVEHNPVPGWWGQYARGVVWAIQAAYGSLSMAFSALVEGAIPIGAGLSSSASLQSALALFLLEAGLVPGHAADLDDDARMALAHVLRRSENEFVGVSSGLLDQFSVLFGRAGHALMLDCLTLDYARLSLGDPPPAIVVCDSKTSRRLADGKYNQRFEECRRVVTLFQALWGDDQVRLLRDVTSEDLRLYWDKLDPVGRLRARHVLSENERVRRGGEVLRAGDLSEFGRLMSASHASSRDDFENSSPALDALIECAESAPGFLGGKLSGAGWAGCTVNLVRADQASAFAEAVRTGYARRTGKEPEIHVCRAADGASAQTIKE